MNITVNSNRYNNYQNNSFMPQNKFGRQNVSFTSNPAAAIEIEMNKAASGSGIFKPFTKAYNSMTDWIANNVISHIANNTLINKFADNFKNNDKLFNHMLAIGSLITSGLYVKKTLDNKDMDKDRKNTLAINQTLTFILSTVGAYSLDSSLNKWWNKVTSKYVGLQINDKGFLNAYEDVASKAAAKNKAIKQANKSLAKDAQKPLEHVPRIGEYLETYVKEKELSISDDQLSTLSNRIKGMDLLKKMIVFGAVYRFLVPVLVTPFANKFGEYMIQKRKAKEAAMKAQQA